MRKLSLICFTFVVTTRSVSFTSTLTSLHPSEKYASGSPVLVFKLDLSYYLLHVFILYHLFPHIEQSCNLFKYCCDHSTSMSDKIQVTNANTRKRKAFGSLMDDDKVVVESSNDSDGDMDDSLISFGMMLAGNSCFTESDVDEDYADKKTQVHFMIQAIGSTV